MAHAAGTADIAALPNLGAASAAMLEAAGIRSAAELRRIGAVAAYRRVQQAGRRPSLNLLWALEGAIAGEPWQQVARERRNGLLTALEDARGETVDAKGSTRRSARAPGARGGDVGGAMLEAVERFALSLPDVTQAPHHHFGSFRVRGRIFVTVPPGNAHLHVFVADDRRDEFLEMHDGCCEKLRWGGKVVGLRVTLANARLDAVKAIVLAAWDAKAARRRR